MREIKFRAWNKEEKVLYFDVQNVCRKRIIGDSMCESFQEVCDSWEFEVNQYTNLKDKNGKDIYEGDIESDENGNLSVVCYLEKYGAFCFVPVELYVYENYEEEVNYRYGTDCYFHNCKPSFYSNVIGNIYENPELLEVE